MCTSRDPNAKIEPRRVRLSNAEAGASSGLSRRCSCWRSSTSPSNDFVATAPPSGDDAIGDEVRSSLVGGFGQLRTLLRLASRTRGP